MTHLRKMMLEELERRNYAQTTIHTYIQTIEEVCQFFCVNDWGFVFGDGVQGKGVVAPSPAHLCRSLPRVHCATLSKAGIRSGHRMVKWLSASRQ